MTVSKREASIISSSSTAVVLDKVTEATASEQAISLEVFHCGRHMFHFVSTRASVLRWNKHYVLRQSQMMTGQDGFLEALI